MKQRELEQILNDLLGKVQQLEERIILLERHTNAPIRRIHYKPKWTEHHDKILEEHKKAVAEGREKEFVMIPRDED